MRCTGILRDTVTDKKGLGCLTYHSLFRKLRLVRQRLFVYIVLTQFFIILLVIVMVFNTGPEEHRLPQSNVMVFHDSSWWKNTTRKRILLWTRFWRSKYWIGLGEFGVPGCAKMCDITFDKRSIKEADIVLFHLGDLWFWTRLPTYRRPDQIWAIYNAEPPHKQSNLAHWNDVFNWTISYRKDSTVYTPFGDYVPLSKTEKERMREKYENRNFADEKRFNISMTISNCYNEAKRYRLVDEIRKYVDVDMFGDCGDKICEWNTPECNTRLKQYKFHLALENSYCKDYFTEKVWRSMERDVVPIVAWKQNPGSYAPPNSVINIFHFPSVKLFANYVIKLLENDTLYNTYFEWKKLYKPRELYNQQWCFICDALFKPNTSAQLIRDPYKWLADDYCEGYSTFRWMKLVLDRWLFNLGY